MNQALELLPNHGHYLLMKGMSLVELERVDEARAVFEAILSSQDASPKDKNDARGQIRKLDGQ